MMKYCCQCEPVTNRYCYVKSLLNDTRVRMQTLEKEL